MYARKHAAPKKIPKNWPIQAQENLYSCGKDEKTASMMRPLIRGIRRGI
jgi:hypothetical protein